MSELSPEEIGRKVASDLLDAAIDGHDWDWDEDAATKVIAAAIRSTISEQAKRIAELEVRHAITERDACEWAKIAGEHHRRAEAAEQSLTSERQRREEADAVMGLFLNPQWDSLRVKDAALAYFRKYEPGK